MIDDGMERPRGRRSRGGFENVKAGVINHVVAEKTV
jgi:hypothetical protein